MYGGPVDVRQAVAESLETGEFRGIGSYAASRAWGWVADRRIARRLVWPDGKRVVAIGGPTLGGSGKTPLALACALHLARAGVRTTLVGHAYRASPGRPRLVAPDDDVALSGDEALMCARALAGVVGAEVIVAPTRQGALDLAFARGADVVILDGTLQTTPRRATLSLLAVEGAEPWGAGACPPAGDLRASVAALLAASDRVIRIGIDATPVSRGAWSLASGAELLDWCTLRTRRVGLVTAVARPHRVLARLAENGVIPACVHRLPDHAWPGGSGTPGAQTGLDLWLTTPKCRTGLPAHIHGIPVATLDYALKLGSQAESLLGTVAHSAAHSAGP